MSSITSTGLAPVTTNLFDLYLYFQDNSGKILEAYSKDGSSWTVHSTPVAKDANSNGAPLTAYYVEHDADHDKKGAIHVFFLNTSSQLAEMVKVLPEDSGTGGTFKGANWNPDGSQWMYYSTSVGSKTRLTEIRRTPSSPWKVDAVLPEQVPSLPGTKISAYISGGKIDLYLQDHASDIRCWENTNNSWTDRGVLIKHDKIETNTPIGAFNYGGKRHLILVDNGNPQIIQDYVDGNDKPTAVVKFYPGSTIGVIVPWQKKPVLFYKSLDPVGAIETKVFNGGKWEDGVTVVK